MRLLKPLLLLWAALLWAATPAAAQLLYRATRGAHTVYLLGSVHLLPRDSSALGPAVDAAYAQANALAFELAPEALAEATPLVLQRGLLPPDSSLAALLPDSLHQRLAPHLNGPLGALLPRARPWLAALLLEQLALAERGYEARSGVEAQVYARAQADGRPLYAFETVEAQLALLADAPRAEQVRSLAHALTERTDTARLDRLVALWRAGDAEGLADALADEFADAPDLRTRLLDARNRAWIAPLEAATASAPTLLVVVGAGHLVGTSGLVALLRARGWAAEQVPAR